MTDLARIQEMVDLCCELLKNARNDRGRESLVRQLSYYLGRKRELERIAQVTNNLCTGYPQDK
jgi:hypothetical protein